MKKIIMIHVMATVFGLHAYGQQDAMYSQYMFNMMSINPAYAGNREVLSGTALFRNQWVNIPGAPVTQTFTIDAPLWSEKVGVGLAFYNDKLGVTSDNGVFVSYAYRIKMGKGNLNLGLEAGLSHTQANFTDLNYTPNNGPADPIFSENMNEYHPNFGTGVFYNTDIFYLGISVPHILRTSFSKKFDLQSYDKYQHAFLATGYVFNVQSNFKLKPSMLVKFVKAAPIELDLNLNAWFYDFFAIGASYRTGDALVSMIEINITTQLHIGYAYDYTLTDLQKYNSGSHEIMLRYELNFNKSKMITPRYF